MHRWLRRVRRLPGSLGAERRGTGNAGHVGRIPFLPVARRADSEEPVYLESMDATVREYALILLCLEKKNLVSIDYSAPLKGFSYAGYEKYPVKGSVALTNRGQQVLDLLEKQGIQE